MQNATHPTRRTQRPLTGAILAGSLILLACDSPNTTVAAPEGGIVIHGAGSFTTQRPPECKPLPESIFRTAAMTGPTVTGQWWSSLLWQEFSANLFAHPLAMLCTPEGLAIAYPGTAIVANHEAIMGGGVTRDGDFRIGHSAVADFPDARCGGHSDWFVTASFAKGDAVLETTFGHGSPYVFCRYRGGGPVLTFVEVPRVWSGTADQPVLGVTVRGHHYGLFGASGSKWSGLDGKVFTNSPGEMDHFSIALLPDDKPETLERFKRHAHHHVTGSKVDYHITGGTVRAIHSFETQAMEGSGAGTLFALYPHQWKYLKTPLAGGSYASVRGEMKLAEGTNFITEVPVHGVLPMLPIEGVRDRDRLLAYLREEAARKPHHFADTYWEGKHLGRLTTLAGIAEVAGATDLHKGFITEVRRRLENWFTASPGETAPLFYYNATWGSLIGSIPSYGSDMPLNDHHFHYGYFIRAAAELARLDPDWAKKWGPMVELLIRDIASPDRADPMFPHIRCFDRYAGHSWASGDANFADGNNQESSSESMNAWYGLMLWGAATGNERIRDLGTAHYNIERTAIEEYWFDVAGTNFPNDFPNVALGMVWGGKGAFATWFSADIDCIHGINWLPFTPASLYMGRHPDYVRKNHERIVAKRPGGRDYNNGWGDLVVMFHALAEPAAAAAYLDATPDCKLEGGNTHAFMYQWIQTLNTLGTPDAGVTADHPFSNVFVKDGKRTRVIYHYGPEPKTVKFSDGVEVIAKPGTLTLDPPSR